jgi:hypothetical protein
MMPLNNLRSFFSAAPIIQLPCAMFSNCEIERLLPHRIKPPDFELY